MNTPQKISVLLADDHRIVMEGLRSILEPEYNLVGMAENGRVLVDLALTYNPEVIVADISMPLLNGLDVMTMLKQQGCRSKFIFLTMHKDVTYASKAIQGGAVGYVLKHSASEELLRALQAVLNGEKFISKEIASSLESSEHVVEGIEEQGTLTLRQREVLQLFAEGKSAKEVAQTLGISEIGRAHV